MTQIFNGKNILSHITIDSLYEIVIIDVEHMLNQSWHNAGLLLAKQCDKRLQNVPISWSGQICLGIGCGGYINACFVSLYASYNSTATCFYIFSYVSNGSILDCIIYRCTMIVNVATQTISLLTHKIIHCILVRQSMGVEILYLTMRISIE